MGKTLLHRLFGFGRFPMAMRPILEREGIVLADEGIGGTVTFRNFRAPGRRYSYRKNWFTGSLVITEIRFAGFAFGKPVINVPLDGPHLGKLDCELERRGTVLRAAFDSSDFHDDWSGDIEVRFRTPQAPLFLERLRV
jgi:hypothetical protein